MKQLLTYVLIGVTMYAAGLLVGYEVQQQIKFRRVCAEMGCR